MKVILSPPNPLYPALFEAERRLLLELNPGPPFSVHPIGSTAVPGLVAKPIIDILMGIQPFEAWPQFLEPLVTLGYQHESRFDAMIPDRRFFYKLKNGNKSHHLHLCQEGGDFFHRHLRFRDLLRQNPDIAQRYGELKSSLAEREWQSGNDYAEAKSDFISKVLAENW